MSAEFFLKWRNKKVRAIGKNAVSIGREPAAQAKGERPRQGTGGSPLACAAGSPVISSER
jgi:hypothetical protein